MQDELNFHTGDTGGYESFRKNRADEVQRLARQAGLPVGQYVTVNLRDGRELTGLLLAVEDPALTESSRGAAAKFKIEGMTFPASEVASCRVI